MPSRIFRLGRARTGLGLFATKPIKRGAYIATYRGRRITSEEADRREARGARYMFELTKRWTIDGSPRWNVARYINHSCRPNAYMKTLYGHVLFFALRDIRRGEEITVDYEDTLHPDSKRCRCRVPGCRGTINRVRGVSEARP